MLRNDLVDNPDYDLNDPDFDGEEDGNGDKLSDRKGQYIVL